jgi:hypothetical protein
MSPYETRSLHALAALRMVWAFDWASAAWMAVEMLATLCITKLQGDARPSLYPRNACCRVAAGERVVWRASIGEGSRMWSCACFGSPGESAAAPA